MAKKDKTGAGPDQQASGDSAAGATTEAMPKRVKMIRPYGFIDEETGVNHMWLQDQEVFEPEHIAILIEREAEFTVLEA